MRKKNEQKRWKRLISVIIGVVIALCPAFSIKSDAASFSDVKYEDWYYTGVQEIAKKGIMQGYQNGRFGANDIITREQFAAILYRMAGSPKVDSSAKTFADVPSNIWYTKAVIWANKNGIVKGYNNTTFGTGKAITREQLVTMLYRYASYQGVAIRNTVSSIHYPDAYKVSAYAKESIKWALGNELLTGRIYKDKIILAPDGRMSRAECAVFLQRFMVRCLGKFNGHVVAVDAGHQRKGNTEKEPIGPGSSELKAKVSSGTQGRYSGVAEYVVNLDVSLLLRDELEKRGYQVVMIRETHDVNISNAERAAIANNSEAEVFIRIHCNGVDDTSVRGALTMAPTSSNRFVGSMASECKRLSQLVIDKYCAATGFRNRGIQYADNMSGINWCKIPVTIVEMGFMSNKQDDLMLVDKTMQIKMARGIADGVDAYFGIVN